MRTIGFDFPRLAPTGVEISSESTRKQFDLNGKAGLANLVQEKSATRGELEIFRMRRSLAPVKATFFVAESSLSIKFRE